MPEIIWTYFICLVVIIIFLLFFYCPIFKNNIKEGNTNKDKDTCEFKLRVPGLIREIRPPTLKLFGINILQPITSVVDMINQIIKIINKVIIFGDYIGTKFITCLFYYLLDCYGKILWGLLMTVFKFIKMQDILNDIYSFIDETIDANLYTLCGIHIIHFPTIIQNRCYHIFGDGRIPCWKSPFGSTKNKEGINNISNILAQNMSFYHLLLFILGLISGGILIYILVYYIIMVLFKPNIKCEGDVCL